MFTGIITNLVKVVAVTHSKEGMVLAIKRLPRWKVKVGQSIAINGVCSTVDSLTRDRLFFVYMPESVSRSAVGKLGVGDMVNVEMSLRANDRLDGHLVQGHIDTVGTISRQEKEGNSVEIKVAIPKQFSHLVASKGSVAIDGISLTVVDVGKNYFTVKIIPSTWDKTNLHTKKAGEKVNVEFDVVAKYLERLITRN